MATTGIQKSEIFKALFEDGLIELALIVFYSFKVEPKNGMLLRGFSSLNLFLRIVIVFFLQFLHWGCISHGTFKYTNPQTLKQNWFRAAL